MWQLNITTSVKLKWVLYCLLWLMEILFQKKIVTRLAVTFFIRNSKKFKIKLQMVTFHYIMNNVHALYANGCNLWFHQRKPASDFWDFQRHFYPFSELQDEVYHETWQMYIIRLLTPYSNFSWKRMRQFVLYHLLIEENCWIYNRVFIREILSLIYFLTVHWHGIMYNLGVVFLFGNKLFVNVL